LVTTNLDWRGLGFGKGQGFEESGIEEVFLLKLPKFPITFGQFGFPNW